MIPLPQKPKVIEKDKNKAVFEIEGLYPGYGVTLGNSMRRALLSSLQGAAVTQMKIKGAAHEFSTISGISEDVINIMLNVKQMRFKLYTDEPQKAMMKIKGEKEVKASDFELPSQMELINKNIHIATLTDKKSELEIEIQVEKGIGFSPREERKKEKSEIGQIVLDAVFTPVKKVAFRVENMRVGKRTDFDKLFLEVETDGTVSPEEAFRQASEVLVNHFQLLTQAFEKEEMGERKEVKKEKAKAGGGKKHAKAKKGKKAK